MWCQNQNYERDIPNRSQTSILLFVSSRGNHIFKSFGYPLFNVKE